MRRVYVALLAVMVAVALSPPLGAQTTGKIVGKVVDATTGVPLPGVNVVVEGTARGAATDENGQFFILNMPPGTYTLRAMMIGYEAVRLQNVHVSVNRTEEVAIRLSPTVLEGKEVVVQAERVVIKKDQTSSIRNVSSELMDILPVENVGAVIGLQAGVVEGHFRGGRLTEVAYLVDGMKVTESFGGSGRHVDLEPTAIADLEVITGTFNAEYGRAMSGVVNAVTKDGGSELHGALSADLANYLTSHKDIFIGLRDEELTRNQDYKAQLSGPVFSDRLTFLADFRYQDNKNHLNGVRRFRPSDYSNFESDNPALWYSEHTGDSAYVPMNRSKNLSLMGKLSWRPSANLKVGLLYTLNRDEWHDYNHAFKYNPDGMAATHREAHMGALQLNHMLS
ncbi:MAG: TonB-dependent receptor, partial [candidate division KSB1 bacterium]|nr:TonB-dependent receptor [candidate division KSB1 bacterium]